MQRENGIYESIGFMIHPYLSSSVNAHGFPNHNNIFGFQGYASNLYFKSVKHFVLTNQNPGNRKVKFVNNTSTYTVVQ